MAIKQVWKNTTLYKPKSYSSLKTTKDSGSAVVSNDTMLIIGEALTGKKGSDDGIQTYLASEMGDLVNKYSSGAIVDCALAAQVPSKTRGIAGPGKIMVYKTNAAVQASKNFSTVAPAVLMAIKDRFYGRPGNDVSVTITSGDSGNQKNFTIKKAGKDDEILGQNDADVQITVQYTGDATTAVMSISGASKSAKVLATTLAGDQTDGSVDLSITLSAYTMNELADYINGQVGYSAVLIATNTGLARNATNLDPVTASNIKAGAVSLYELQEEMIALINDSSKYAVAELAATPIIGVPVNVADVFLTGGALGASASSDFSSGMTKALGKEINAIVVAISQDAADDIAMGVTDASSAYDVSTVHTALDTHLRLRGQIKNGMEAQGYVGFRKSTKADVFIQSAALSSELIQLMFEDVKIVDVASNEVWKQPHVGAAMLGGMRLGSDIGEPLTHKFFNAIDMKHYVDPSTGIASGDFDPLVHYDAAIIAGASFSEPNSGGFRLVVDNTTYGKDNSFVWNRGSVIEAAFYTDKSLNVVADTQFVGLKAAGGDGNSIAESIKLALREKLRELKSDNILGASDDAPEGFVEETFSVRVVGNAAFVSVEIKPIQGLDMVLLDISLGNTTQSA